MGHHPIAIPRDAFRFCRWSVAALVWAAVIWRNEPALIAALTIMALSALLTVERAPMVWLYTVTVHRLRSSPAVLLDRDGMRAAHLVATLVLAACLLLIHRDDGEAGWRLLSVMAVFKTIGALGFCPVSRMFTCMIGRGGSCCTFLHRRPHAA